MVTNEPLDSGKPAELSIFEQLARRFERYANDQEASYTRGMGTVKARAEMLARMACWRDAAAEMRSLEAQQDKLGVKLAIVSKALAEYIDKLKGLTT